MVCYILNFQTQFAWRSHQLESLLGNTFSQRFTKTPTCGTMPTCQPLSSICRRARSTFQITCGRCCPDFHLIREPAQCALGSKKWSHMRTCAHLCAHYARICAVFCCFCRFCAKPKPEKDVKKTRKSAVFFRMQCARRVSHRVSHRILLQQCSRCLGPFCVGATWSAKAKALLPLTEGCHTLATSGQRLSWRLQILMRS